MRNVTNHKQLLIAYQAHQANYPADTTAFQAGVEDGSIPAGVVAVLGADNKVETGATSGDYFWIAQSQGAGKPVIMSAPILKSTAKVYEKAYSAAAAQVDYIGYNGSTSEIVFTADEPIIVRASLKSNFYQFQDKEIHIIGDALPTATSTQGSVAADLCKSLIYNSEKFVNIPFKVERVNSDAGAAIGAAPDTIVGLKGSKTVTLTDTGGNTTLAAIAVGDYIRFGTAVTDPVYKIVATTVAGGASGTVTLDIPLQEAVSLVGNTCEYITAANAAAGDFGLKLTGKTRKFQEGVFRYEQNKWITTIAGAAGTAVTKSVVASEGTGTYEQIAEDEWFYQLQEGMHQSNLIQVPPVSMRKNVVSGGTYDQVEIVWSDVAGGTDIIHNPVNFKSVKIAVHNGTTAYAASKLKTAIDANA